MKYCYLNGKIVETKKARVSPSDIGLTRGYGVYDGIMLYNKAPFELRAHYDRFVKSAKLLNMSVPYSFEDLQSTIEQLVKKNKPKNPIVRLLLTGGETVQSINFDPAKPTSIVLMEEVALPSDEQFAKGVKVITHEFMRYLPESKTTNYIEAVKLQSKKIKAKAVEILYIKDSLVYEASTSNIFAVVGSELVTPKNGILPGITKKVVLGLAKKHAKYLGVKVVERDLKVSEILAAQEVFITSSFKEVLPVVMVDNTKIGMGAPGEVSKKLLELFRGYILNSKVKNK